MRNIFKTLSILFFGSIFFLSCEIGLGASVDTEAPNLEIQNPSPDAIIRGVFKIGGTWSDDGTIETVSVKLSRTDGKGKELEYQATFAVSNEDSPNTWNCIINPQDPANIVLDGNYVAQVDITDTGKHTTTKTVQFAIDNTAPVIVLQRPSTKDDAQQLDSYGQKFTLEGQAADDNNVSLIEVQIFADKECTTLLHTVPLSNVPNSINLDVAEFKENIETDYSKIYGSTQKMGQKNFYCKVVAYDGAVYYPYDRTQTPEDLKGNKTNIYYLYEDIATAVLGEVKITDVYHILSGVYGLEKESSRSAETNSLIAKVKSTLEKNVVNTGSFSLNPANNPTFSVSGKEPLQKDENGNVNFASGNYDITNGSQVIMEVTPGLDNIPLDGNSLKVYFIECDAKGTAKSGASKIYPATEMKKSGTTYKYTVSVKKQDGLVIGRNYLFGVDGYDEKKNSVVCSDNLGYGFHFSTSGAAPGLTILEPEAGSVTLANGKKLKISGTTTVEAGTPVITITDNKVNKTTLTFQESEATEDENKQLIYTFSTEIDFTGGSAYHELEIVSDLEGIKTTRTKSVSYDSEKPVIAINSVNPIVEKTEPNGQPKKCLNGEVQISFSLTDDFSFIDTTTNKPYFELWQNNEKKYTAIFTSTNSAGTETVTVDTNKLIDNTPLEIKVFTWDRAGNKAEYSDKQYQIDQSTDKPQITPKNNINFNLKSEEDIKKAGNNENRISMGGTVSFTVTDDDGIDYIAVYSQTKDAQGKITETLYNRYPKEGSSKETQTPYSFILPSTSGYYLYRLEVKDIINTKTENNKQEYQFMIKATSPAPTIELQSEEVASENNTDHNDGYIGVGGSFTNTITIESIESPFKLLEKKVTDKGSVDYTDVTEGTTFEETGNGKYKFTRTVSPTITTTYYYKVEDSNGQYSSEKSVKCKVDNDASTITPKSYPKTKQDTRVSQYTISGTAADTDSGVNKVYIAFANEDKKYSDWKEVGGTENWYYTLKYAEDDNFKEYFSQEKHGIKYIKFKVVDKVGWEYETQAIQFFYDTADPTAEITAYKTKEAENYTTLTSAGVKTGKAFSLKGIATDDWEIDTATLTQTFKSKQNESAEQSLTLTLELGTGGSWEVENLPRSYEQGKENEAALNTGDYEYKLVVKDKAGNETQTILNVEVDITAPDITVGDPTELNGERFINTKNLTITGKIIESNFKTATAKLVKKGESNPFATGQISPDNDGSFSWKVYEVADGEYTVEVYAIDSFGNNTTEKGSSFTVDTIAPISTLTVAENTVYDNTGTAVAELISGSTYYVKDKYTLSGTVTETNFKSAKLGEETLTASSGPWSKEITPNDETTKTQKITLEDKAGNKTVYTVYVSKDTSAPLLTVTSPTEGVNEASITVKGQVSDLGIGVESVSYELYKVEDTKETKIGETQTLTNKAGQFDFTPVVEDLTGDGKGEGKYKIKVTAQDKLGNKTTETVVKFMYDKSAPELSDAKITTDYIRNDYTVGSGEKYTVYAKDTFDIEVNAIDLVSGVNTVTAESGNTKVTLTKDEQGNGTGKYKGSITAQLDDKNTTTITIKATDFCSQTRIVSITNIMVDKVAPTISNLNYSTTPQKNKFTISVSASDLIALAEVNPVKIKYKYKKNESEQTLTELELPMTLNNGVYEIELTPGTGTDDDSVHYIPDGNHTFTIEATDKAGNKASRSISVLIDTTAPKVGISKTPSTEDSEGTVYVFEGTANDGSGSGVSEIWMKFEGTEGEISVPVSSTWLKSITFSDYEYFNTSGEKKVLVKAKDRAGNESLWTEKSFDYDKGKPEAEITAYKTEEAAGYTTLTSAGVKAGKAFSLKGKATDDWEVTSVTLTQKQGENKVVVYENNKGGDWEVERLPRSFDNAEVTNVESGEYEYVLEVTDKAGKKTQVTMKAGIDTTAPVITVNDLKGQNNDEFINTKNLSITGKIIESNFKTATAKLMKQDGSNNPVATGQISPDNDGSFSWKVYEVADGEYTVEVYAKDDFGNENTVTGSSFTVDTTAPVSTLTATENQIYDDTGTAVAELTSGSTYYVKGDYRLSGTVTETNFKSVKLGEEEFDLNADGITWDKEITPSDETTKTQTITLEDKAGNRTVYTVYVSKDTSSPLLTVTSPTEGGNAASITVTGQVSDLGIGVASVSYELYKDGMETPVTTQTLTNIAGQFAFTSVDLTGEGEGKYTIKVTAQDKLGNKKTEVINFMYDKSAPELSDAKITTDYIRNDYTVGSGENQITYTVYDKDTFVIEVNATDLVSGVNTVTAESGNTKVTLTKDEQGNGTGKYKGTITAVLNKDNITTITIKATDFCNQTSTVSIKNIMVDKVAPTISNLTYPTTPQKNPFTISVSASDLIALAEDKPVKIKYKKNESDEILTELPMTEQKNGNYQIELTPGTGTDDDSVHYIPDGNHTFTIEATDKAGNKASQSIEVVTDVTAPTWVTTPAISSKTAYEQTITENGNSETRNYYKSNLININVKATDKTSGVKEIVYNLDSTQNTSTGNANITLDNLSEGKHTVSIKAVDEAGNVSNDTILIFYIDTQSPLKPELMSIDSESGAALEGYKDESKSKLVNGKSDVTFVLSASDASSKAQENDTEYMSGIKSVEVLRIASNNVNIKGQKVENENGKYTITIPKDNLATGSVTVRITDNVGNTYEGTVFNLQLDNTPPVLKISSPADGATVNKTITISGATTDNNAVAQTVVTVKKGETEVRKETFTAENSNELSWSLDLDTFIQNITNTEKTENLTITVTATDKAGNTKIETRTITVDQDKDRPVISFNNVTLGNAMSSSDSNYIWLKNTTELYGTVEDDDGIKYMKISNNGTNWHDVTLNTAKTSWSFDVKTFFGDETADKEAAANGAHKIYFKVTDKEGEEFNSATLSSLDSVYLVDGVNKYGEIGTGSAKPDSVLYVKVDTLFPEVILIGARIGTTGDFSNAYSNMTLGGAQRTMEFKLTAKDSNGIKSVSGTAEFEFDGASVTLSSPEDKTGESGDEETTVGETDAEYYIVSFTVDLENENAQKGLDGKDGRISLKFTAKDKAGNSSAQTATINYDYKKPEVTITSPKDSNWVSGIVTAYGTIDSAATMYYALSPSNEITPAEPDAVSSGGNITGQTAESGTGNSHEVTSWSGINPEGLDEVTGSDITVTPKYSQIKGNGVQWFVYFDNQPSTELATHDVEFKKYLINSGITTDAAIGDKLFTTIVKLYLWVKSIDLAGNITEEKFPILIDPQGDAPQVTISYPAKDGEKLGGTVTLLGTASDTIGTEIGIKNVWVQIMSGTDDLAAKPTIADVNLWIKNGYNVYTNINKNPTQVTSDISSNPENYYIQANVSGSSWSLKINENNEFNPKKEGITNTIVYRVYAQDKDNNLSKYQTQYSIFDADNPILSDLYLRQYSDNENGEGDITASRPYEDDMWIKGDWWLYGTVKDTQGIKSLKVGEKTITVSGKENAEEEIKYKISTKDSDAGNKTISIVAEDNASPSHTTPKTCSINYDNKDPDSFEPVIANNKIQNANGFFTFSAEVKENAIGDAAQSGFKYLAFYFTRGNKVYDIMRSKTDENGAENSAIDKSNSETFPTEDGLIWKKLTVTRDPDNLAIITLRNADKNIHTGGLCKIGGSIYMIKNASGTTIELDGSPEKPASGTSQEALFAIANVVNNNIESGNGTKSTSDDYYGYFNSISNDDGDHMVESVLKTGTTWKWEANINSRNIPDGEVTLHYVAFDAAGNYSAKEITGLKIANNAPRLASVKVWTDYNGNGIEDDNEYATKYYSKKTVVIGGRSQTKSQDLTSDLLLSGNDKDEANDGSAFMTIKAETKLIPEIVGGNGNLYYTYRYKNSKEESWSEITKPNVSIGTGNDDGIDDEAGNGGYYVVDDENTAYISGTIYDGKTENKKPIVITTDILGKLNNNTENTGPTWFEYVIYDSTEGCKAWSDSDYTSGRLSAKFKVALNVQYNDIVKPQVAVRPFYWNSKTDNSVCWKSGSALGHIELEGDLSQNIKDYKVNNTALGEDPKVSGKIKIEGYAFDNIKLKELYVQFDGHKDISSEKLAATYTTSGSWEKSSTETATDETATEIDKTWDFEATDVFNNSEGHLVYWTLTVDTQAVSGQTQVVRLDQKVTVIAKDERGKEGSTTDGLKSASSGTPGKQEMLWKDVKTFAGATTMFYTDEACNNLVEAASDDTKVYLKEKWDYQMDIVPYITGVNTSLSTLDRKTPSKFDRTALGHYPVRIVTKAQNGSTQAETVTFTGFNLGSNPSLTVSSLTTVDDPTTGGKSAKYSLSVNNIPTLNNMNNNNAKGSYSGTISDDSSYDDKVQYAYNRQPNNANNNRLTDDIIFDVWEFNSVAAVPISGKIEQPVMKIRPTDGKIGFAFVNGPLYFSMGGSESSQNYSYQYWMASYDFFTSVGFTYDDAGNSWGVAAGGDINSSHADKFQLMSSKWGLSQRDKDGSYSNTNSMRLESIGMKGTKVDQRSTTENFDKQRIRSPSLAATDHGSNTNLYLAYYDAMNDELRFKAGREGRASYLLKVIRTDNPGSNYAGAWVVPPNNNKDIFADGDLIYLCDKDGNLSEDKYYTLGGYWAGNFDDSGKVAFVARDSEGNDIAPFPGTEGKGYTEDGNFHNLTDDVYIKVVKNTKSFVNGSSFYDFDTTNAPYSYRNSAVNIVAGDGVTGYGAGEYVSLGVVPGSNINDDVVVITWYDTNARTLYYSYNETPLTNRMGIVNQFGANNGWFTPVPVFEGKDYDYAGEYCKIAVDKNGGIHIAAYDPVNLDLVYAYAESYNSGFKTCVVDSNGVVGSNLTLDVALDDNNKAVPFIGYYATSCIKPKYARLVGGLGDLDDLGDGSINDEVTGKWEISVVPTSSIIEMQSNQHNDINIGVWKNNGEITNSKPGDSSTSNTLNGYNSNSYGQIYGNGTKNPVLGYAIKYGSSSDTIETAQMK